MGRNSSATSWTRLRGLKTDPRDDLDGSVMPSTHFLNDISFISLSPVGSQIEYITWRQYTGAADIF